MKRWILIICATILPFCADAQKKPPRRTYSYYSTEIFLAWPKKPEVCRDTVLRAFRELPKKDGQTIVDNKCSVLFQGVFRLTVPENHPEADVLWDMKCEIALKLLETQPFLKKFNSCDAFWIEYAMFLGEVRGKTIAGYSWQEDDPEEMDPTSLREHRLQMVLNDSNRRLTVPLLAYFAQGCAAAKNDEEVEAVVLLFLPLSSLAKLDDQEWKVIADRRRAEIVLEASRPAKPEVKPVPDGYGLKGRLEPYTISPDLKEKLARFDLLVGNFTLDLPPDAKPGEKSERLPFLLYVPRLVKTNRPVPLVVYIANQTEHGETVDGIFRQPTLFEKVTDPVFQERTPCYVFAPVLPSKETVRAVTVETAEPLTARICDAMYAVIREAQKPPIDSNRIYVTGNGSGGTAAFALLSAYPGRFAACLPVSGYQAKGHFPENNPGRYWLLYDQAGFRRRKWDTYMQEAKRLVESRGGEFRLTPHGSGPDAWRLAWKNDEVWAWLFSKSNAENALPVSFSTDGKEVFSLAPARCTASQPGKNASSGPERAVDGLDASGYVSLKPLKRGDWWMCEFPKPLAGEFEVQTGWRDGKQSLGRGWVEVSSDGRNWRRAGNFREGVCSFSQRMPIRFLKVLPNSERPAVLVLRSVAVSQ